MTTDNERLAEECEREASISRGLQYITAADLLQRAANALRSVHAQGAVMVPVKVVEFLRGAGPLDGIWFGEYRDNGKGAFWWRKYLPAASQEKSE